jgi:hypothetical protein
MITAYDGKKYATFEQWKAAGYFVMRGEKSYMITEDSFEPLFCETQVYKKNETRLAHEHPSMVGSPYPPSAFYDDSDIPF